MIDEWIEVDNKNNVCRMCIEEIIRTFNEEAATEDLIKSIKYYQWLSAVEERNIEELKLVSKQIFQLKKKRKLN
jgi:hypothetical protein